MKTLDYISFHLISHQLYNLAPWRCNGSHNVCVGPAHRVLIFCSPAVVPGPVTLPCGSTAPLPLRPKILNETKKHSTAVWWLVCRDRPPARCPALPLLLPCVLLCLRTHLFPISQNAEIAAGTVLWLSPTYQKGLLSVPGDPRNYANSILMMARKGKGVLMVWRPLEDCLSGRELQPPGQERTVDTTQQQLILSHRSSIIHAGDQTACLVQRSKSTAGMETEPRPAKALLCASTSRSRRLLREAPST